MIMGINMKDIEEEGAAFENAMSNSKPLNITKEEMEELLKNKKPRPNEIEIIGAKGIVGDR